jgi:DNA-binding response OmpR family regulator
VGGAPRAAASAGTRGLTGPILVIDDDPDIQFVLEVTLEQAGLTAVPALTGEQGLLIAADLPLQAALVDLRLPGLHGLELIPTLRASSPMPIIVITAQTEGAGPATALGLGADDYLTKPFAPRDLIHRLTAQLAPPPGAPTGTGRLTQDPVAGHVRVDGHPLPLTQVEQRLLATLLAAGDRPVGANELLRQVWGYTTPGDHTVVASMVTRVQRRLAMSGAPELIRALPTGQYRLDRQPR